MSLTLLGHLPDDFEPEKKDENPVNIFFCTFHGEN